MNENTLLYRPCYYWEIEIEPAYEGMHPGGYIPKYNYRKVFKRKEGKFLGFSVDTIYESGKEILSTVALVETKNGFVKSVPLKDFNFYNENEEEK